MNFSQKLGDTTFSGIVFNASGPACTTLEELEIIGNSQSAGIMMKSCSPEPREGNPKPRYAEVVLGSINSMGLPNYGYKAYGEYAQKLKEMFPEKPVITSIVGFSQDDFLEILKAFQDNPYIDVLEINLSCPNVVGKPQIAYDFETTDTLLKNIFSLYNGNKTIGFKLPPYFDPVHTQMMAEVLQKYPLDFITCINSVGNTLIIDPETEQPLIKPKGGLGGLGGDYIKPVALANVRMFYKLLGDKVQIIGCGGIKNGIDVFEHILAGASFVQIGTQFAKEGPEVFERVAQEFYEYIAKKGYTDIEQFRGKLKELV